MQYSALAILVALATTLALFVSGPANSQMRDDLQAPSAFSGIADRGADAAGDAGDRVPAQRIACWLGLVTLLAMRQRVMPGL
jgi:hypothetical protein